MPGRRAVALLLLFTFAPSPGAPAEDKKDDRPAEKNTGMKSRVFEVKYRSPEDLVQVLRGIGSGVKGSSISESNEFRTITVRDFPENLADMEAALKRLDVPTAPKPDVELRARVLLASPSGGQSEYPKELEPAVKQMRGVLAFKNYLLVTEVFSRVRSGGGATGKGAVQLPSSVASEPSPMSYSYGFEEVSIVPPGSGGQPEVRLRKLAFWVGNKHLGEATITTGVTLKEGQTYVVGTAAMKERAIVLVLSARVVK